MDPQSPLRWKSPDEQLADARAASEQRVRSPFYDGLIAGALLASIAYAMAFVTLSLLLGPGAI